MSKHRGLLRVGYVVLASALLLEAILQVGAGVMWLRHRPETGVEGPAVLCVGDSWTFGVAASNPATMSYPARLQAFLGEELPEEGWAVVNRGLPGQDSRDVLSRLPAQLAASDPHFVCILIGQNDGWSRPELLDIRKGGVDDGAFRLTWRTARLAAWTYGKVERLFGLGGPGAAEEPSPVGPQPPRHAAAEARDEEAWRARQAGDPRRAIELFEEALALHPLDTRPFLHVLQLHAELGETAECERVFARLERAYDEDPTPWGARTLVLAMSELGWNDRVHEWAERLVADHPESSHAWVMLAKDHQRHGDQRAAEAAIDRILDLEAEPSMFFWRLKIYLRGDRPEEAIRSVMLRYLLEGDERAAVADLRVASWKVDETVYEGLLAELECTDEQRAALVRVGEIAYGADASELTRVLDAHLGQMVELCRERGAEPVLIGYALGTAELSEVPRAVAARTGASYIDVRKRIAETEGHRREDFFAAEGHFNDLGYGYLARWVADELIAKLRAR